MATVRDLVARLEFTTEADALDFLQTGRMALLMEDNQLNIPLPTGPKGEQGPPGPAGKPLRPDIVIDEPTDLQAMEKLRAQARQLKALNQEVNGYFAINKPTKTGFFYTRGGWVTIESLFGGSSEVVPGKFTLPVYFESVAEPQPPASGCVMYFHDNKLKIRKSNGAVVVLG